MGTAFKALSWCVGFGKGVVECVQAIGNERYLLNTIVSSSQLPSARRERQVSAHTNLEPCEVYARTTSHRADGGRSAGDDWELSTGACRHLHGQATKENILSAVQRRGTARDVPRLNAPYVRFPAFRDLEHLLATCLKLSLDSVEIELA